MIAWGASAEEKGLQRHAGGVTSEVADTLLGGQEVQMVSGREGPFADAMSNILGVTGRSYKGDGGAGE